MDYHQKFSLLPSQRGIWLASQTQERSIAYNITGVYSIKGYMEIELLKSAIKQVIDRHQSLRLTFSFDLDELKQQIMPIKETSTDYEYIDIKNVDNQAAVMESLIDSACLKEFDLSSGVLIRTKIISITDNELRLVVVAHHVAADGYSFGIFIKDLFACYSQKRILPELSFKKFVEDSQLMYSNEYLLEKKNFWLQHLGTKPSVLNLPYDFRKPNAQDFKGRSKVFKLSKERTTEIVQFVASEKTTMLVFLLGVFKVFLYKITQQQDIVVGVPFSGRNNSTNDHIGMFVNTVAIKSIVQETDTFRQYLRVLTRNVIQGYKNQYFSLDQLFDSPEIKTDFYVNQLFNVIMVLHENLRSFQFGDLKVDYCEFESKTCQFDLTFEAIVDQDELNLSLRYRTELFQEESIDRFISYINLILDAVLKKPEQSLENISVLSSDERLVIESFRQEVQYPKDKTIIDLFQEQVVKSPNAVALIDGATILTYRELNERSNKLGYYLKSKGVKPETIVPILMYRSWEMIVCVLGILKAGGAYLPMDPQYPQERIDFMIADANAHIALTSSDCFANVIYSEALLWIIIDADWQEINLQSDLNPTVQYQSSSLAYVIYTSGSTGRPKGVMVENINVVRLFYHENPLFDFSAEDVWPLFHSFCFDFSVWEMYGALFYGGRLIIVKDEVAKDSERFADFLVQQDVTILNQTPSSFYVLQDFLVDNVHHLSLKYLIFGGEVLNPVKLRSFDQTVGAARVINMYGITETTVHVTFYQVSNSDLSSSRSMIGKAIPTLNVYILDQHQHLVPIGKPGEIYVSGPGLARGYLNLPELTKTRFLNDPFSQHPGERMYKTGDIGKWLPDGNIEYLGRNDDQVKIRGYRIEPAEIEMVIAKCPLVKKTVVLVTGNKSNELRIAAYVVPSKRFDRYGILSYLNNVLPHYMIPGLLIEVPEIPLTSNGKIDKKTLLGFAETYIEDRDFMMPCSSMEINLAEIWKAVLNIDRISVKDNFFHLGGHSLSAIRLCSQIRRTIGLNLFPKDIFSYPVLHDLAMYLESADKVGSQGKITAIERPTKIPLSFGQERMWFIDQSEGSIAYHISVVLRIKGLLDQQALYSALQFLVERHEILRTVIDYENGQGFQSILPSSLWKLTKIVFSGNETEDEVRSVINQFINKPFNLLSDYNLRAELMLVGEHESILIMNFHHIGFDGWSIPILLREIGSLYNSHHSGVGSMLETLAAQYADYAIWQRKYLTPERLSGKLEYWKGRLSGSAQLNMPFDFNKPKVHSRAGATFLFPISGKVYEDLQSYCMNRQTTLYITLLTAFNVLLSRYSGQEDISVGTPVAGRIPADTEGLIGFFVNTVVIRSNLEQDPSFDTLLQQIKNTVLEASENEEVPFDKVVESLSKDRQRGTNPLFQVMFSMVYKEDSNLLLSMADLDVSFERTFQPTCKFDLSFFVEETKTGLEVNIEYSTALFQQESISRMAGHYKSIIANLLKNPSGSINSFPLLTDEEQLKLINNVEVPYASEKTIVDIFEQQVIRSADAIALICGETRLSYKVLNERSNRLGNYLRKKGVKRGAIIPICMPRCCEMVVGMIGILKAGAAYLPIDPQYPKERIDYLIEDAQGNMLLTHSNSREVCAARKDLLRIELDVDWAEISLEPDSKLTSECTPADLAYVIYTSGSTGKPKGVMIEHFNVVGLFCNDKSLFNFNGQDVWTLFHSFWFDFSVWEMYGALFNGSKLVIVEEEIVKDVSRFSALLVQQGVTVLNQTPSAFYLLQDFLGEIVEQLSLRYVIFGGEALNPVKLKPLHQTIGYARLINMYGITETTVHVTFQEISITHLNSSKSIIGKPIPTLGVYILDQHQLPVPIGVPGELYIIGSGLARGYLNLPEMTDSKFLADPFRPGPGSKMYKSGDIGKWLPDGSIEYLGRNDNQVKIRGYRIETGEIESVLIESKLVNEVVVIVREDVYGNKLIAYFTAADAVSTLKLRKVISKCLPAYYMPSAFINLPEIPLTSSGKIDRNYLAQLSMHALVGDEYREPSTELEIKIAAIWKEFLSIDRISSTDLFFNIGGSSLLVIRVIAQMRQEIGVHVAIADFFTKNLADIAAECNQIISLNNP
ncbi:non-ribosomal peptide synthetase [Pedobacter jejuensis]|nr:non-ribosomal peptide synthetase [Pedobacter jejuensis]